ncbi:MAG TPA: FimV/HubP family polar landmark protein [Steroidobacteraceae bacterium]|jgi:pilus assembly protein FimV|nr:FimV/HubP family polar landmark protein [Steroidobacteraceae bacterium]
MTAKSLKWTLAALIVGSPAAMALGLGDIHLHSSLNAPLDADIDLIGATPDDLASLKAQVAPREAFQKNGLDWPAFLSSVTLKPMHTSDGRDILKVHSGVAITEPFVTLLVEINWARGQVSHEYTVLLDPPVYTPDQGQAAAPVAAPVVGTGTRDGTIRREQAAPPPSAPAAPQPASASDQTYRVQRGDSLSRIAAHEAATTSPSDVRRWMVAAYEGNPASFDKNMNVLRAGSVLRLPDAAALGAVSTSDALAEVRRQYAAWHSSAAPGAGTPAANNDAGRLHLVTPGTAAGTAAAGATAAADTRALQGKIQQLQSQLDESQRLLSVRNADLAKLQEQLQAAQAGKSAAATVPPPAIAPAPVAAAPPAPSSAAEQAAPASEAPASTPVATESAAPASAPPVRHRPHVVPVPVEQHSSMVDTLAKYWWALAALIIAGAALFGVRAWRERRQSSFDDSLGNLNSSADSTGEREATFDTQPLRPLRDEAMLVEESGSHMKPRFDGGTTSTRAPHIAADQTISAETAVNLDQGDPLAEADFHMAYGLYDQAADLVRIAIARDPTRRDLKLKLLEVYFVWGNKEQFLNSARELATTRAEAAPGEWEKILIMGKQLAPEDPLFAAGGAVSGAAAAGVDLDLEGGQGSGIDFDVLGSPSAVNRAADDIDLDIGTAIGERDAAAESAAAMATDKNLALHSDTVTSSDGTGSTQEMTAGRLAAARFGGLNDGVTQESPTIEQPLAGANGAATVRQKVEKVLQQTAHVDQTAELAIDDLGLDLNSLDTVDQPALGSAADAPTMVAGLDERSRRLLETAEHRGPAHGADPAETPTGSWQFDGAATDAPMSIEGAEHAEHDIGATATLAALSSDLDFNLGTAEAQPAPQANGHQGLDLDVGTATIPDAAFAQTQRLGTEDLALPDLEPVTMSEVGTKLDLARAYMDMGDPEGARNILEEVVTEGSVAQKQEAQRLIESLPG